MRFKSLSEATRAAVDAGATLDVGGRLINAGGARGATAQAVKPTAAMPAEEPMAPVLRLVQAQARATAAQGESMVTLMKRVLDAQDSEPVTSPRPMPIAFDVERNEDGLINRIVPVYYEFQPNT